jgi:hypothetical protein
VVPSTYYGIVLQHSGGRPPKMLNFDFQSPSIDYPLDQRTQSYRRSFASFNPVTRFTQSRFVTKLADDRAALRGPPPPAYLAHIFTLTGQTEPNGFIIEYAPSTPWAFFGAMKAGVAFLLDNTQNTQNVRCPC